MNQLTHRPRPTWWSGRLPRGAAFAVALLLVAGGSHPVAAGPATPPAWAAGSSFAADMHTADEAAAGLRADGLTVELTGRQIRQPFFAVPGEILRVNGQELQLYVYPDVWDRFQDARISPDGSRIKQWTVSWAAPAHVAVKGNLLALFVSDDQALAATIERAIRSIS